VGDARQRFPGLVRFTPLARRKGLTVPLHHSSLYG
jgi:hypothetical protein